MELFLPILVLLILAALAPFLSRITRYAHWMLAAGPLFGLGWLGWRIPFTGTVPPESFGPWSPTLGVEWVLRMDGLSAIFCLLICLIGALVVIYTGGYLAGQPKRHRFYGILFLFMASMLGVVLAGDLITLFIFWEMTGISSYLLIGFHHEDAASRKKALQALLVTGAGGLALLAGILLLGQAAGTYRFSEISGARAEILNHSLYPLFCVLILIGAFTKSAQIPFHFWLPNAMAAPTPVSSYLHSATMVKAGVYLLARLSPTVGGTDLWQASLVGFGAATLLTGAFLGLRQTDLKKILAYTTLSVLGILTMLIGLGTELAIQAAMIFLIGHALYKAALFMCAGGIDHETGTREVTRLRGLRHAMPWTAVAAGMAALSKAGFPPFFGFIGKEYVYKSGLALDGWGSWVLGAALIGNMLLLALAFKVGIHPFWGTFQDGQTPKKPHEGPIELWLPPLVLAGTGLLIGLLPHWLERPLVEPAVASILGIDQLNLKIALWQGFNLPLLLSTATVAGGIILYRMRDKIWSSRMAQPGTHPQGAEAVYVKLFEGVLALARKQTLVFQSGKLSNYLLLTCGAAGLLLLFPLSAWEGNPPDFSGITLHGMLLCLVMGGAAVLACITPSRLTALLALGIVGLGVALLFVLFSAPDLAITQVLVESLIVVLFMFVAYRLPRFRTLSSRPKRVADALFSGLAGIMVTVLVIKSQQIQFAHPISDQLAEWSYQLAKGKNVVNVILVDFRALDTFGEVLVLIIAALGVVALVRSVKPPVSSPGKENQ